MEENKIGVYIDGGKRLLFGKIYSFRYNIFILIYTEWPKKLKKVIKLKSWSPDSKVFLLILVSKKSAMILVFFLDLVQCTVERNRKNIKNRTFSKNRTKLLTTQNLWDVFQNFEQNVRTFLMLSRSFDILINTIIFFLTSDLKYFTSKEMFWENDFSTTEFFISIF